MSVLKGPNAAALYGSRASNGVVVITTKKGRNTGSRARVDASQVFTFDTRRVSGTTRTSTVRALAVSSCIVDGAGGGAHDGLDQSFGPRIDGRTHGCTFQTNTTTYDRRLRASVHEPERCVPVDLAPGQREGLLPARATRRRPTSRSPAERTAPARVSRSAATTSAGIIPNNFFQKTSGLLNGTLQVNDKLSTNATLQYVRNTARNRPGVGYNNGILEQFIWFGRNVDMNALQELQRRRRHRTAVRTTASTTGTTTSTTIRCGCRTTTRCTTRAIVSSPAPRRTTSSPIG